MGLYTGKGDDGTTRAFDSHERMSKGSALSEALGTLDEVNSFIGLCKVHAHAAGMSVDTRRGNFADILDAVQQNLFTVQAEVAGAKKKVSRSKVAGIERVIHVIDIQLPPITTFSVAGGTELSALLDVARTLARRAERRVVGVHDLGERRVSKHTLAYLNRLSSLLFALARLANHKCGIKEASPKYR
jgi:cob(I)alamin adenosyltransferase